MRKLFAIVAGGVAGSLIAGSLGLLIGEAPAFHWELAGLVLAVIAALAGALAGTIGAASRKASAGAFVGAVAGGSLFAVTYLSQGSSTPISLVAWGTIAAALAAATAGVMGGAVGWYAGRNLRHEP
jgi:hypothetical protein